MTLYELASDERFRDIIALLSSRSRDVLVKNRKIRVNFVILLQYESDLDLKRFCGDWTLPLSCIISVAGNFVFSRTLPLCVSLMTITVFIQDLFPQYQKSLFDKFEFCSQICMKKNLMCNYMYLCTYSTLMCSAFVSFFLYFTWLFTHTFDFFTSLTRFHKLLIVQFDAHAIWSFRTFIISSLPPTILMLHFHILTLK